ncbi:MAG: response regulator [Planctomycetota bacterium]|nr:response regulator [Planctomycetota bacterium]
MDGFGTKQVLNVGQCQPDHSSIREFIQAEFGAEVEYCADISAAMKRLCEQWFDLVLVNRIIDATLDEGSELIQQMKESEFLREVPVMMVSNFDSAQVAAADLGAVPGFGKARLEENETRELLRQYLGAQSPTADA